MKSVYIVFYKENDSENESDESEDESEDEEEKPELEAALTRHNGCVNRLRVILGIYN